MRFRLYPILLCFLLFSANLVNSYNTAIITPENLAQISQISSIESSYLGEIAWSGDSNRLAVGTSHDGVHIFNANNLILPRIRVGGGLDVLFHPNNQILASAGTVWNIPYEQEIFSYGAVDYKIFSPDGHYLITAIRGSEQTAFTVYQVLSGNILHSFSIESPVNFNYLVFSEDSSRFALLFENTNRRIEATSFIQVRESATGTLVATFDLELPQIKFLTFSNGGLYLAAFNYEETYAPSPTKVIIWEIATQIVVREFGLENWYPVMSPDRKWMYVADFYYPYIINLDTAHATGLNKGRDGVDITNSFDRPSFSLDGKYIALQYAENMGDYVERGVLIWEMEDVFSDGVGGLQQTTARLSLESSDENPNYLEFSPDSQSIAIGYQSQTIVWDIEAGSIQETIPVAGAIRFMPYSSEIRIGNNLWNSETDTLLSIPAPANLSAGFYAPILSPDGKFNVSRGSDSLQVQNHLTGEATVLSILDDYLGKLEYMNPQNDLAIFRDTALHAYDLSNQQEFRFLNPAPREFITSDDGSILVAFYASQSNLAQYAASIYHLRGDNENPITLNIVLDAYNFDAVVSPNNQYLLVSESDAQDLPNRTALYSIETGEMLASWSAEVSVIRPRVLFSPDSQYVLTMATERSSEGDELKIKVWELAALLDGETEARNTIQIANGFVYDYNMSFNPFDNQLVVMADYAELGDGPAVHGYELTLYDWDTVLEATGIISDSDLNLLSLRGAHSPAFNPNSSLLLTRGTGRVWETGESIELLVLWDMETAEAVQELRDFKAGAFNPDATLLAGLSTDSQLVFWDMAALSEENPSPIFSMDIPDAQGFAFSSDGSLLYVRTSYSVIILGIPE